MRLPARTIVRLVSHAPSPTFTVPDQTRSGGPPCLPAAVPQLNSVSCTRQFADITVADVDAIDAANRQSTQIAALANPDAGVGRQRDDGEALKGIEWTAHPASMNTEPVPEMVTFAYARNGSETLTFLRNSR